jgi:hypothetical protein
LNKSIKRRDFLKQTAQITSGLALSNLVACKKEPARQNSELTAMIPMPVQIVIDDVGWWSGEDGSTRQEPYRTGIGRNHVPADYQAIADLGARLGVRPQAATVLCEWDRNNILRKLPTSTWMREKWDNSKWVGPWLEESADIIRNNERHYELTLHGIGHEYWENSKFTRAEWADRSGRMRPLDQVELHLDFYARLLDQNQLGAFPKSFVPTAFLHTFGPSEGHKTSLAEIIKKRGINYINTPFYNMFNVQAVQFGAFGIDAGVITIDRGEDLFDWNIIGGKPAAKISGPTCGLHWPNLLHADPERNSEIVDGWVKYLARYNTGIETLLAPDSTSFQQQLAHCICTATSVRGQFVELDFTKTRPLPEQIAWHPFVLKIRGISPLQFRTENIKIISDSFIRKDDHFLYTLTLERTPEKMSARIESIKAA